MSWLDSIKGVLAKIAEIDRQIEALSMNRSALAGQMAEAKNKLESAQAGFDRAAVTVKRELNEAIGRLRGTS